MALKLSPGCLCALPAFTFIYTAFIEIAQAARCVLCYILFMLYSIHHHFRKSSSFTATSSLLEFTITQSISMTYSYVASTWAKWGCICDLRRRGGRMSSSVTSPSHPSPLRAAGGWGRGIDRLSSIHVRVGLALCWAESWRRGGSSGAMETDGETGLWRAVLIVMDGKGAVCLS